MAVHSPWRILAIELNPNAYHYLCLNIKENRVESVVSPYWFLAARPLQRGWQTEW
nr:hypothetical protein [Methanothrix sp.]